MIYQITAKSFPFILRLYKIEVFKVFKKISASLKEKQINIDRINQKWHHFLNTNQYLTSKKRNEFLLAIKESTMVNLLEKIYLLSHKNLTPDIKLSNRISEDIDGYNENYIKDNLILYKQFFEGNNENLHYSLDQDQRRAVIIDDKYNLVIAGAGSGKTSVITSKIAYLIRNHNPISPDRILALAFTNVASEEMCKRLKKLYDIDIQIATFHSLGLKIIKEEMPEEPRIMFTDNSKENFMDFISSTIQNLSNNMDFRRLFFTFIAMDEHDITEEEDKKQLYSENKQIYFEYMRNKRYTTLNNIDMKSMSEQIIGNYLFINGIEFQYESEADWINHEQDQDRESENNYRKYHPDFYLPEYDIYIEHWGMNEDFKVPDWFTISSVEYRSQRKWKLKQYQTHNKKLVESWDYNRKKGKLLDELEKNLRNIIPNITFQEMTLNELIQKTAEAKIEYNELVKRLASFIKIAKSNSFSVEDIEKRVENMKLNYYKRIFGKIAVEVYRTYQDYLISNNAIDFNDMINLAVQYAKNSPDKYNNLYDYILVDEFQDISYQRLKLIKGLVNDDNKAKLFCVGDDWQSIFQFNGSDVRYFVHFDDYFEEPAMITLKRNYRSTPVIIKLSNYVISQNKDQINKEIFAGKRKPDGPLPLLFELESEIFKPKFGSKIESMKLRIQYYYNLIRYLLDNGVDPPKIMIISRFNRLLYELKVYCGAKNIPTESKHGGVKFYSAHKSKGSEASHVILIDIISDKYGFPCEIEESSVMQIAQRLESTNFIEEERRLFYVALTRSKKFLYIFTGEGFHSTFIEEIKDHVRLIHLTNLTQWERCKKFLDSYLMSQKVSPPIFCLKCGRLLERRSNFYGSLCKKCNSFLERKPETKPKIHKEKNNPKCPKCGNKIALRKGKFGLFFSCSSYPNCTFKFDLISLTDPPQYCPKCGGKIRKKPGRYGFFYGCSEYPKCTYIFKEPRKGLISPAKCPKCGNNLKIDEEKNKIIFICTNSSCNFEKILIKSEIKSNKTKSKISPKIKLKIDPKTKPRIIKEKNNARCPECGNEIVLKKSKFGLFFSCSSYPECIFKFDLISLIEPPQFCPECGGKIKKKLGNSGYFYGCSKYPKCPYVYEYPKKGLISPAKCPKCENNLKIDVEKNKVFLTCTNPSNCNFEKILMYV